MSSNAGTSEIDAAECAPVATTGSSAPPVWSSTPAREYIDGVPYLMYPRRARHLREVLSLADRWADEVYVVQGEQKVTFGALLDGVATKAQVLVEHGVGPGDVVLLLGWNSPEWIVNFWACQEIGAVPALANAWWSAVELRDATTLLSPVATLADARSQGHLPDGLTCLPWETSFDEPECRPAAGLRPTLADSESESDPAVVIFTSGTSGRPKAVELSHRALLANLHMLLQLGRRLPAEVDAPSGEVALHTGPLFHVGGPQMLMRTVALGNTIVLPAGRFDPADVLALVERHRVTRWSAVPTMVTRVLDHPDLAHRDLRRLTSLTIGGAPVHAELLKRIGAELPGVKAGVPTGYGLTENGGQATAASGRDTLLHPGSAGQPLPCAEVAFKQHDNLPDAEVLLRSPTQMTRYIGVDDSPIDADGWLHTGDLGRLDAEGRLWITGRAKELIIRGGENIAPAAVEQAIASLEGVADVAVIGTPHPDLGEEVCAFVVVTADSLTPERLAEQLRGRIASFAVPSVWYLRNDPLPTNQTGKVDKPALAVIARSSGHGHAPA